MVPGVGGCGLLDAICDAGLPGIGLPGVPGLPGIPGLPNVGDLFGAGIPGLGDIPNPFESIGDVIAKAAADAWTAAMLAIWNSGLFVLRIVLTFSELFLTPDLSADGPGKDVYAFTLWLALALVVILAMIQLGAAAFKREGKGLARAFIGAGQFVLVCACWFGYCVMIVAACGAITKALMKSLLKVQTWPDWDPLGGLGVDDITDAGVATALAFLGIFLWLAAIGHILVYLARAASLLVLTATGPLVGGRAGLRLHPLLVLEVAALVPRRGVHPGADGDGAGHRRAVRQRRRRPPRRRHRQGVRHGTAGGDDDPDQRRRAAGAVQAAGLRRPRHPQRCVVPAGHGHPGRPPGPARRRRCRRRLLGRVDHRRQRPLRRASRAPRPRPATGSTSPPRASSAASARSARRCSTGTGLVSSAGAKATSLMSDETNQAGVGQSTYGPDFSGMGGRQSGQSGGQSGDQSGGTHPGSQNSGDPTTPTRRCRPRPRRPPPPTPPTLPTGGGTRRRLGRRPGGQGGGGAGAAPKTPAAAAAGERPAVPAEPVQLAARSPRWRCSRCAARPAPARSTCSDPEGNRR